jgi:hypothetical protein
MAFDIDPGDEVEFKANEDRSWLLAMKGMDTCRSVTLDVSAFSAAHIANGAIPSGTVLTKLANTKYGPYVPADTAGVTTDDVTEVSTITRTATGGVFKVLVDGLTTADISAAAAVTAAAIQAAIRAISPAYASVTVTGSAGGPFTVTWVGLAGPLSVDVDDTEATGGTVTIAEATAGAAGTSGTAAGLLFNTTRVGRLGSGTDLSTAADVGVPMMWEGIIDRSKLPAFAGTDVGQLDAAAEADMPSFRFER